MPNLGRVAVASSLSLCLSLTLALGCDETSEGSETQGGASSAAAGSAGSLAAASGSGRGGDAPTEAGGAQQGGAAGDDNPAAAGAGGDIEAIEVQAVLDSYRSFTPQTPEPVSVSGYIFGLCRLPTLPEKEFQASIHGEGRYLRDWANPSAEQGLAARGNPPFPVGSVIVKEKFAGPQAEQADRVAIGLMIKRGAGFDPEHGDWDYAYYEPALGIVQNAEQTAYCSKCHAGAAATDFVFVDGLMP